jgi:uncharacterized membrane protein YvlD (DUF360 family)
LYILFKYLHIGLVVNPPSALNCEIILILWLIFWLIYDIAVRVVKLLAFPLSFLLGGIFSIFLNIIAIYAFAWIVNSLNLGIKVTVLSLTGALVVSVIIGLLNLLFKKL